MILGMNNSKLLSVIQYLVLVLGISCAALLFQNTHENLNRFIVITIFSLLYIPWGYWHHAEFERGSKLILLEYSLVSFIVILLSALGLGIVRFF